MSPPSPKQQRRRHVRRHIDRHASNVALVLSLIAILVVAVGAVFVARNTRNLIDIKEGRRVGVASTCPLVVAVIDAGSTAISGSSLLPGDRVVNGKFEAGKLTRFLGDSFPAFPERKLLAARAATRYKKQIATALADSLRGAGVPNAPISGDDIKCDRYAVIVKAP